MVESGCADGGHSIGELRIRIETIASGSVRKRNRDPRGAAERRGRRGKVGTIGAIM